ncbi:MAG: FAD-binding oxidoreductase [Deltaproteobacteria bacterium]|nr:FAD-binding oxidoreductase [Deltaproteobacteria bacterium]
MFGGEVPARCDVAIIGAGFAGVATGAALAARGIEAILLERAAELGAFASGRGAGLGRQLAEDDVTAALAVRGAGLLRTHHPGAWSPTGGILTFDEPAHGRAYIARAARLGVAHEVLDRAGVLQRWPDLVGLRIASALYVPGDGVIDIRALLHALAAPLRIAFDTAVELVEPAGPGVRIATARGVIEARVVVDASGAWAGALTGDPGLDVYRRHLYVLEAAAQAGAPYLWHLGREEMYVRREGDGILVSPCDSTPTEPGEQPCDETGDLTLHDRLATAQRLLRAPITRRWACQRAFTPDRTMRLGIDPRRPWLVWAAALGGHGATCSLAVGETVADAVVRALG